MMGDLKWDTQMVLIFCGREVRVVAECLQGKVFILGASSLVLALKASRLNGGTKKWKTLTQNIGFRYSILQVTPFHNPTHIRFSLSDFVGALVNCDSITYFYP